MAGMQGEIHNKFNNIDQVRANKERRRNKLFKDRDELASLRQKLKDEVK